MTKTNSNSDSNSNRNTIDSLDTSDSASLGNDGDPVIALAELRRQLAAARPPVLAEILPLAHYEAGHIPGAIHLTLAGFDEQARAALPDRDAAIVVYCSGPTCHNSEQAARRLATLGFSRVRVFRGGKAAWTDAGLALVGGAA